MTNKRSTTRHKVAAVLVGGLVLGVGAATTLAAWTDSQQATATFTAGVFKLESRTDSSDWAGHPAGGPAVLAVGTSGMSPGSSSFGYLDVKTSTASTLDGTVQLEAATPEASSNEAMVSALEFRAKVLAAGASCEADALTGVSFVPVISDPKIARQNVQAGGVAPVRYCLEVRIKTSGDTNAAQGKTAKMIWTVTGASS